VRAFRSILAAYVLVWFTMVVPAHTRGVVVMPGAEKFVAQADAADSSCCHGPKDASKPTKAQQKHCAVCFVASALSTPVVYVIRLDPSDCIGPVASLAAAQVHSNEFPAPYWPTGPPATL
jgi:hypothetical protein